MRSGSSPKNSELDQALQGRGFQPRRKCLEINSGFSRRGEVGEGKEFAAAY
jgi:hypothetical protein